MRLVIVGVWAGVALLGLSACVIDPDARPHDPRYPTQTGKLERIDPYHTDEIPDTPYEIRKAELERARCDAGKCGPTYPPLFREHGEDKDE